MVFNLECQFESDRHMILIEGGSGSGQNHSEHLTEAGKLQSVMEQTAAEGSKHSQRQIASTFLIFGKQYSDLSQSPDST